MGPPSPGGLVSEVMGPSAPADSNSTYGPEPMLIKPVVLVFGPGLARSFAYAGVLKALQEEKIPVGAIIATETGSLIGALYANSATINNFEWSLSKLKDETFAGKRSLFSGLSKADPENEGLDQLLARTFGEKNLTGFKTPLQIVLQREKTRESFLVKEGQIKDLVRSAMAVPGVLAAFNNLTSAGASRPFAVSEARLLGSGPVVVIDVLSPAGDQLVKSQNIALKDYIQSARGAALDQLKDADLVITPNLSGLGFEDYQKKNDIIFRGKKAALAQQEAIRHLVGLPPKEKNHD
ncbi:MAG: patatin-like phospholipase family protein [Methylotenera sp.]|nr:patatin-like phospholipase family protein [Oligoflexia bacterium]